MDTRTQMTEAMRAYEQDPTPERREAMVAAQRAHDAEREQARREADAAEYRRERDAVAERMRARLAQPVREPSVPVGLVSRERAEWLGMAAVAAGGGVLVDCPTPDGIGATASELLGYGALPSGQPVADRELHGLDVVRALRAQLEAWARHPMPELAEDYYEPTIHALDAIEGS